MKRTLIALISTILCCLLLFAGCAENKEIIYITDVERYADMQQQADKIDVDFENGTQKGFQFTITDEDDIDEIMSIIFSDTLLKYADDTLPPGFNTKITIYQGEKSYTVNVSFISENGKLYSFSTNNLKDKITVLAVAAGAFGDEYALTVQDPHGHIIEPLKDTYKAGEKVTVKTTILYDVGMIAYLDGVSLGSETAVKTGDSYTHWEYYFIMPDHDAVLSFEFYGGM